MTFIPKYVFFLLLSLSWPAMAQQGGISGGGNLFTPSLLRVEQAFRPQAIKSGAKIDVVWTIEPGYYLYRNQFRVFVDGSESGSVETAQGETTYDPFFDQELEIYREETQISFVMPEAENITIRFQGCADAGYCYPPSWAAFDPSASEDSVLYLGLVSGPGQSSNMTEHTFNAWNYTAAILGFLIIMGFAIRAITRGRSTYHQSE